MAVSAALVTQRLSCSGDDHHAYAVALHFLHCNFGRVHKTLRVTPAMEADLPITSGALRTSRLWHNESMESCPKCSEFSQRLKIHTPNEYQDIARQLIEVVRQGTFLLVRADCPLEEILEPSLPGDFIAHEFECFACGRKFRLAADTLSWQR